MEGKMKIGDLDKMKKEELIQIIKKMEWKLRFFNQALNKQINESMDNSREKYLFQMENIFKNLKKDLQGTCWRAWNDEKEK